MQARRAGVLALLVSLVALGCQPDPIIENTDVGMDLGPCLGAIEAVAGDRDGGNAAVLSTCRTSVNDSVDPASTVNVCFIAREVADNALTQRIPYTWRNGSLSAPFPERVLDLGPARRMDAALFFLSAGDEDGTVCEQFEVDSACDGNDACVMRLLQAEPVLIGEEGTTFDFTDGEGRCNSQVGPAFGDMGGGLELCDGMDNDCDRVIDEGAIDEGNTCGEDLGVGACAISGTLECRGAQGLVCSVTQAEADARAAPDENCDEADCCDGVDADCDGVVDENIPCSPCETNEDCAENIAGPICVEGLCKVCDPADHDGCSENDLCCGTGPGAFECQGTSFGPEAGEQCAACGDPCIALGPDGRVLTDNQGNRIQVADGCSGRGCSCGFGAACADPTPFCTGGQCVQCRDNSDCGDEELCCDGVCEATSADEQCGGCGEPCNLDIANRCVGRTCRCGSADPCRGDEATCVRPDACIADPFSPDCRPQDARCVECDIDLDCSSLPDRPACVNQRCEECRDDDDSFCSNNASALAEGRLQCVESSCRVCDARRFPDLPIGEQLEAYGCSETADPARGGMAAEAGPICNIADGTCGACEENGDCATRPGDLDRCVDGKCVVCNPENYDGCSGAPGEQVCDRETLTCRGCTATVECQVIDPESVCNENGICTGCIPGTNENCNPVGPAPICEAIDGAETCRSCRDDDECPAHVTPPDSEQIPDDPDAVVPAGQREFCYLGRCSECKVEGHVGCAEDADRPICTDGDCRGCRADAECLQRPGESNQCILTPGDAAEGQCKACDPADNAGCDPDGTTPVCDARTFTCVACADDAACNRPDAPRDDLLPAPDPPVYCVAEQCVECRPDDNSGCNAQGDLPYCDPGDGADPRAFCRSCLAAADCVELRVDRNVDAAAEFNGCVQGRCTECDPATHAGCPDTQFCNADGRCQRCNNDGDCGSRGDGRSQCVDVGGQTECQPCDPSDFAGCDPNSAAPACDPGSFTCRGCDVDVECRADDARPSNPNGDECVDGVCRACDPSGGAQNAGCNEAGTEPYCDPDRFVCVGCSTGITGDDSRCENNRNAALRQCVDGRCSVCDPQTYEGCDIDTADPICDDQTKTCRPCGGDGVGDGECARWGEGRDQCVNGACEVCDPQTDDGCNDPGRPICAAERGQAPTCRPCEADDECPGALLCVRGSCTECDPLDNRGCDVASADPFCGSDSTCRPCQQLDAECVSPDRSQCVDQRCEECDPAEQVGCDVESNTPYCGNNNNCRACDQDSECLAAPGDLDYCQGDRCVECRAGTRVGCGGDTPFCEDGVCRPCANNSECGDGANCVGGRCQGCTPGTNALCDTADAPFCDRDGIFCRACADDGECRADGGLNPPQADIASGDECFQGKCTECDPGNPPDVPAVGCDVASANPICNNEGTCVACSRSAQCELAPGDRDFCVDTECEVCDPATHDPCALASNRPICREANGTLACRSCQNDGQCATNPNGDECVQGFCAECDPRNGRDNAGCDPDGTAPICEATNDGSVAIRTCRGCEEDSECADRADGKTQCFNGACVECDPTDHAGCAEDGAAPICDALTRTCRACEAGTSQCAARPGDLDVCVEGRCRVCDDATYEGCDGTTPICDGGACRACRNANDCGDGRQCVQNGAQRGACSGCNPETNAGCELALVPCDPANPAGPACRASICDDQTIECRQCEQADCAGAGQYCVAGQCEECDPANHDGCLADELCCQQGGVFTCIGTDPGSDCRACDVACDADTFSACTNRSCVCGANNACGGESPFCVGGLDNPDARCSGCRDASDCDPASTAPFCDNENAYDCRACTLDADCAALAAAGQQVPGVLCVGDEAQGLRGACRECEPTNNRGCDAGSNTPICDPNTYACAGCDTDDDCIGNENGGQCVAGACVECDQRNDDGCDDPDRPECLGDDTCGCAADGDCGGRQCIVAEGVCADCDPADNAGCDQANAPYCDANRTCQPCTASPAGCAGNESGTQCDAATGACVECLVGPNHDGCGPTDLCCGPGNTCEPGDLNACTGCGEACPEDRADACIDRVCTCGGGALCAEGEICDGGICVECVTELDCANDEICDGVTNTCRGCVDGDAGDAECALAPNLGDFCVQNQCEACDPNTHEGCADDELCCGDGNDFECIPTVAHPVNPDPDNRCNNCFAAVGVCPEGQVCVGRVCQEE